LFTHYPGQGVYNVGLSGTVRSNHTCHTAFKLKSGGLRKRLETLEGKAFEMQLDSTPHGMKNLAYWRSSI
jgi:hypothetical protein